MFPGFSKKKCIVNNFFASIVLVHIYKRHICGDSPFVSLIFCRIF